MKHPQPAVALFLLFSACAILGQLISPGSGFRVCRCSSSSARVPFRLSSFPLSLVLGLQTFLLFSTRAILAQLISPGSGFLVCRLSSSSARAPFWLSSFPLALGVCRRSSSSVCTSGVQDREPCADSGIMQILAGFNMIRQNKSESKIKSRGTQNSNPKIQNPKAGTCQEQDRTEYNTSNGGGNRCRQNKWIPHKKDQ